MQLSTRLAASALVVASAVVPVTAPAFVTPAAAGASCPWLDAHQSPARRTAELMARMTLGDKIQQVTGTSYSDQTNHGAAGIVPANARLCIPVLALNDAGAGMGDQQVRVTAFPDGVAQTATWNRALTRQYGAALGREAFTKGINVVLAPGVDIARTPLNGRNFEYAGEDPYLAGQAAVSVIRGIQSRHVIATVKHFAANDQETNRMSASSDVGERTMEEIDLPAFRAAVQQGHVGSVMCSYNRFHDVYACQNPQLLRHYLDRQMGFRGWVMSDWLATHSTVRSAKAGLDMEMPTGQYYGSKLKSAVQAHTVPMRVLNDMVHRILITMFRVGLFDHRPQEGNAAAAANASTPASIATATKVAEQGSVLLKNARRALPLTGRNKTIAVIGDAAGPAGAPTAVQGYGSGHVPEAGYQPGVVSPLDAIRTRAGRNGDTVAYAPSTDAQAAAAVASAADTAVVFVNDVETEGADRPDLVAHGGTCSLAAGCQYDNVDQNKLVAAVAAANPRTIVVVQSGGPIVMPWLSKVAGVVENWYPGQVDGNAIAPLLFGDVNPSGKLPVTFPKRLADGPLRTKAQYPGVDRNGIPQVHYSEGLLVGYRWYQAKHIAPLFPFGFGLSYTTFRFGALHVLSAAHGGALVTARLTNTGHRAGAQVAQIYVHQPARTGEPPHQLVAFRRVLLRPGRSATIRFELGSHAFAHWDTRTHAWRVAPGCYGVALGSSSAQLPLRARIARNGGSC
ncbi:MAG TPA: glycoside hydrolase family 3 C-terminal domain-containing protein [Jatrophihabitans sp.]